MIWASSGCDRFLFFTFTVLILHCLVISPPHTSLTCSISFLLFIFNFSFALLSKPCTFTSPLPLYFIHFYHHWTLARFLASSTDSVYSSFHPLVSSLAPCFPSRWPLLYLFPSISFFNFLCPFFPQSTQILSLLSVIILSPSLCYRWTEQGR